MINKTFFYSSVFYSLSLVSLNSNATIFNATPSDYQTKLSALKPGDTLNLAAGTYPLLSLTNLQGTAKAWITVQGPKTGKSAIIAEKPSNPLCCNLVQLENNAYIAIKNLRVDSAGYDYINGVNGRGTTHHILVENCTFVGQDNHQENVAISTKGTAWNWTIRRNKIFGAGTGMYLGNSDGRFPFINGIVENNLVVDTIGYNIQVKWQQPYTAQTGLDSKPHKTIIRNNVLIKRKGQSDFSANKIVGARPNLLVGGFPDSGTGSSDFYEIYGNFFYQNPDEALFQGSGRVIFHDNVLVGGSYRAATFQNHDLPIKIAQVFNNTIYSHGTGIVVSGTPQESMVAGNLIFADSGVTAPVQKDNIFDLFTNAGNYLNKPSLTLGAMDFYPKAGALIKGAALDTSAWSTHVAYDRDFNGKLKADFSYRGAYSGEGINSGWLPKQGIKKLQ
jgi:hypothetical protein